MFGRFSPDNRWVSFTARIEPGRGRIARSHRSTDQNQFRRAPGSQSRRRRLMTTPTGHLMGRRCTLPPGETDIAACGAADRSSLPPASRRGLCGTASSRTRVLWARRLVGCGRTNRTCARRDHWEYLDDAALRSALTRPGAGTVRNSQRLRRGRGKPEPRATDCAPGPSDCRCRPAHFCISCCQLR